ncbi:sensor histidine kinase [Streptomyces sp. TLI_105]|uniref:sensor histidine kinase n=1 Tax=Streptomyces sp. TLI_105 TaxID=1881019 RepID=UPI000B83B869|nr:sensor histidine kinase [Streptomyces sp. TLI_105]
MKSTSVADRLRDGIGLVKRSTGPLPRPTRHGLVFDAVLALGLFVVLLWYALDQGVDRVRHARDGIAPLVLGSETGTATAVVALAVLAWAPLALRRRYPLAVLWIVTAVTAMTPYDAQRITFYASVIAAYTAAVYSPYRVATLMSLPALLLANGSLTNLELLTVSSSVPTKYVPLMVLVPLVLAANGMRTWKVRTAESQAQAAALEREQAEELRRAAERERARIARELHDVVTHNVSMMVIQAGAARTVLDVAPDQTREALLAIEASGRTAMSELRHTMGLLTMNAEDGGAPATTNLTPQPGLDQLESLIARVRHTGTPVTLNTTGTPRDVPAGIGLAAYRVVQEALTNTVKHASGASATVTVDHGPDRLRVEVTDTGGSPGAAAATGNGRGLIGLRERLAVYGGTLQTKRRLTGGYRVTALIPLDTV